MHCLQLVVNEDGCVTVSGRERSSGPMARFVLASVKRNEHGERKVVAMHVDDGAAPRDVSSRAESLFQVAAELMASALADMKGEI